MAWEKEDRLLIADLDKAAAITVADEPLIHRMFEAQAKKSPNAIAVTTESQSFTYAELNARATFIARGIVPHLTSSEPLVGIYVGRTVDMIAGILGIMKAGAAYLPLDPNLPDVRLEQIVGDAIPDLLLCDEPISGSWAGSTAKLSIAKASRDGAILSSLPRYLRQDALAYVMYTSGTTGRPKGVEIYHAAVVNLIGSTAGKPGFGAEDVLLSATRMTFDVSVLDFFLPLSIGAQLHLVDHDTSRDPARLAAAIDSAGATVMQATPATWRALIEAGWNGSTQLRIWSGGERLERSLAERLLPKCAELWNLYGPTETTIWSTVEAVESEVGPVAIGCAVAATTLHILDDSLAPMADGHTGELCIGGAGLARGYRNRPNLTAERFVTLESGERVYRTGDLAKRGPYGTLLCLGRTDDQVKIRGFRVEIGEVEGLLQQHPLIAWCAVRCWADTIGNNGLFAYVVGRFDAAALETTALAYLREQLPDYMVPLRVFLMPALPLTSNGKIDRSALPSPADFDRSQPTGCAALTSDAERRLAEIWGELLGPRAFTRTDDFFDLGGYSLLTVRLMRRIAEEFGTSVNLGALFASSDLQTMAKLAESAEPCVDHAVLPLQPDGTKPPLVWLDGGPLIRRVARLIDPDQPVIGLNVSAEDERFLTQGRLTISALARCMLERLREAQPVGPYRIGGWCRWGIVAYELACLIEAADEEVAMLILLDAENPASMSWRARGRLIGQDWKRSVRAYRHRQSPLSFSEKVSQAADKFSPSDYGGEVLLIQPMDGYARRAGGGWRDCVKGTLEVRVTPGDHESMVRAPHATALAGTIREGLARLNFE